MRFSTTKDVLLKGIQVVQSGISSKSSLPILANMLIDATGENVIFTTTDLDIGIISTTLIKPAVVGGVTIPTKKFFDVIKELPDIEAVTISAKKNNTIHIECGTNMFKVMGLPKEEFPQLPEFKNKEFVPVHQKKLKEMLTLTSFAVSNDETRYVLNGVLFVIKPGYVRLFATDGRRLAVVEYKTQLPKSLERKMIVPAKAITELGKILGDEGEVKIFFSDNQALFDAGQTRLVSRLVEGDFPNYEQVIPKETKDKVFVGREKFIAAIKRVADRKSVV